MKEQQKKRIINSNFKIQETQEHNENNSKSDLQEEENKEHKAKA